MLLFFCRDVVRKFAGFSLIKVNKDGESKLSLSLFQEWSDFL